jgi:YHYH protein
VTRLRLAAVAAAGVALVACGSSSPDSERARTTTTNRASTTTTTTSSSSSGDSAGTLTLDTGKDYGDEYADGILPVGDGRYTTDAPKQGSVYVCRAPAGEGGAMTRGPWFANDNTEYDINKKVAVEGDVQWDARYSMSIDGETRVITTNDLPRDHTTGVFPVQPSDPAYQYDRNPNSIAAQSLTYRLDAAPSVEERSPSCVSGEAGVMNTGVALFDAFDAGGRDAGAWEVQDGCDGHPQISHEYHYHTLSSCIRDTSVRTVIGFALDGFPITGPMIAASNILTTADLDVCHGITSEIELDGKTVTMYHYVMTQDFPYSVSCFRGTAVQPPGRP